MANNEKLRELMASIHTKTKEFIDYVNQIGNQCAYTDRLIEDVIQQSKELESLSLPELEEE